ncbi:MAG: hypothetical protein AAB538_03185, partial [Patescibacteria group bacterium]
TTPRPSITPIPGPTFTPSPTVPPPRTFYEGVPQPLTMLATDGRTIPAPQPAINTYSSVPQPQINNFTSGVPYAQANGYTNVPQPKTMLGV